MSILTYMPQRKVVLANGEYYHVFNRSINKEAIFTSQRNCIRVLETFNYYRYENPSIRLSYYLACGVEKRKEIFESLKNSVKENIKIISFCLMPNHFHLLLRQEIDNGISKFLAQFQNSYTRYFNTKNKRQGHLFQGQFKAIRIEDNEQLIHVNRYIHLNPYTSFVVKTLDELSEYRFSSLYEYLDKSKNSYCMKEDILSHFTDSQSYKQFLYDQSDYQRTLDRIKHLLLE